MSAREKIPHGQVLDRDEIGRRASGIKIALMDAQVLHSSIVDLLEKFEYQGQDKETIDSLYTFTKFLDTSLRTIRELSVDIEEMAYPARGAA